MTDSLDRIADRPTATSANLIYLSEKERDALVEVARAAQGVLTQMDYETPHHSRLKAALARLPGTPEDGAASEVCEHCGTDIVQSEGRWIAVESRHLNPAHCHYSAADGKTSVGHAPQNGAA